MLDSTSVWQQMVCIIFSFLPDRAPTHSRSVSKLALRSLTRRCCWDLLWNSSSVSLENRTDTHSPGELVRLVAVVQHTPLERLHTSSFLLRCCGLWSLQTVVDLLGPECKELSKLYNHVFSLEIDCVFNDKITQNHSKVPYVLITVMKLPWQCRE